jgi:hypothetical protein
MVDRFLEGYNCTIFAYGEQQSGKTYSLVGTHTEPGLLPRTVEQILRRVKPSTTILISCLSILNEQLTDLL